jgi:N-acetylmuramoyl-L-alanine amidase
MILQKHKRRVVINAGHDDHDPGKVVGEYTESTETKLIRNEVIRLLEEHTDFEVHSVPDDLSLIESIKWANELVPTKSDGLLLDIHLNAFNTKSARGSESFYSANDTTDTSYLIAEVLTEQVSEAMDIPNRGAKPDTDTFVGSLGWVRQTKGEASLIEVCFMTNPQDWAALKMEGGYTRAATGIVTAILAMWGEKFEIEEPDKEEEKTGFFAFLSWFATFLNIWAGNNMADVQRLKEAYEEDLLSKKNVLGVGVGEKAGETAVAVLVEKKEALAELKLGDIIPAEIEGVKTDVIEIGEQTPMACTHCDKERPVHGGLSAIWTEGTACTLGAIVYKDGKAYGLQNTHCANPHWKGAKIGDAIMQPSPNDGGDKKKDIIGKSSDYEALKLDGKSINYFDTALVDLEVEATPLFLEGLGAFEPEPRDVKVGDQVWKSGRTTGVQTSKVLAVNVTMICNYGDEYGRGLFRNQIVVENTGKYFTAGGDSSSLVINNDRHPVGQIFAGSSRTATLSPIRPIMERFQFTFDPEGKVNSSDGYMALAEEGKELYMMPVPETIQPGMVVETQYAMNFRDQNSITGNKKKVLPKGTRVEIIGSTTRNDGYVWAKVRIK